MGVKESEIERKDERYYWHLYHHSVYKLLCYNTQRNRYGGEVRLRKLMTYIPSFTYTEEKSCDRFRTGLNLNWIIQETKICDSKLQSHVKKPFAFEVF